MLKLNIYLIKYSFNINLDLRLFCHFYYSKILFYAERERAREWYWYLKKGWDPTEEGNIWLKRQDWNLCTQINRHTLTIHHVWGPPILLFQIWLHFHSYIIQHSILCLLGLMVNKNTHRNTNITYVIIYLKNELR